MTAFVVSVQSKAIISACGKYRFFLSRRWDKNKSCVAFIAINPSIATDLYLDQTMCNCNNLAIQWGYGGFLILNLFPFYSTDPKGINHNEKMQIKNDRIIEKVCKIVPIVIVATGNKYIKKTEEIISKVAKSKLYCISKNKGNGFLHPARILYKKYKTPCKI